MDEVLEGKACIFWKRTRTTEITETTVQHYEDLKKLHELRKGSEKGDGAVIQAVYMTKEAKAGSSPVPGGKGNGV